MQSHGAWSSVSGPLAQNDIFRTYPCCVRQFTPSFLSCSVLGLAEFAETAQFTHPSAEAIAVGSSP